MGKYEEALEIAKNYYPDNQFLDTIFPELRKSEDERIRKSIIHILQVGGYMPLEDKEKAFAYLEKLKDASKAIETVKRIDKYIDENVANAHDMKDSNPNKKYYRGWDDALGAMAGILQDVYFDEKQKEKQKECCLAIPSDDIAPAEEDTITKNEQEFLENEVKAFLCNYDKEFDDDAPTYDIAEHFYRLGKKAQEEQDSSEPIPDSVKFDEGFKTGREVGFREGVESVKIAEWNEEDAEAINMCLDAIPTRWKTKSGILLTQWFKDHVRLQPTQKWSEEDEKDIAHIIRILDNCYAYGKHDLSKTDHENLVNKLESLRPQLQRCDTYYDIIHNILDMLKDKDFTQITPEHRVSLLNDIRVRCKHADEWAKIIDEPHWKPTEEQIQLLQGYMSVASTLGDGAKLKKLIGDLKKLL